MKKSTPTNRDRASLSPLRIMIPLVLILALAGAAYQRNTVWQTLLSLWQDCAAKAPDKSRTHNNLGNCYMLLGRHFEAISEYERAIELDRGNIEAYFNIAVNLDTVGLLHRAAPYYDHFCRNIRQGYAEAKKNACRRAGELSRKTTSVPLP